MSPVRATVQVVAVGEGATAVALVYRRLEELAAAG